MLQLNVEYNYFKQIHLFAYLSCSFNSEMYVTSDNRLPR